jgi:hypothetical protein
MKYAWVFCLALAAGCTHVRPSQRAALKNPAMRFEMEPGAAAQRDSILEISEGATFRSAGSGTPGVTCRCK